MIRFPPGLEPVEDLTPADWVREALEDWPSGRRFLVRDLVPPVFEAFARVLHRPRGAEDHREPTGTWRERAIELGRELRPETTWWDVIGTVPFEDGSDASTPEMGRVSESEVEALASFVTRHTADPSSCWFAVWSGWGFLGGGYAPLARSRGPFPIWRAGRRAAIRERRERRAMATLSTFELLGRSGRSYVLLHGSVADAHRFHFGAGGWFQSPTLWWPDDRAWFVHTEIDAMSTYVGGSQALVDSLVGEQIFGVPRGSRRHPGRPVTNPTSWIDFRALARVPCR